MALSDSSSPIHTRMERSTAAEMYFIFFIYLAGLGLKEYWMVAQHNRLRSRVHPMAANMQKMVCSVYCLAPLCPLNAAIAEFAH